MRFYKRRDNVLRIGALPYVALLVVVSLLLTSSLSAQAFPVYDALLYMNKPDLTKQGLSPIRMIYERELWRDGESRDNPDPAVISAVAKQLNPSLLTCVDIEQWPTGNRPGEVIKPNLAKYISVMSLIKQQQPGVKIGYYGVLPGNDYWRAIKSKGQRKYDEWRMENIKVKDVATAVDAIFTSFYTRYSDQKGWETYAIENLKEARKYGKPVYVFLWPQYMESSEQHGAYLPADYWRLQLETCLKYADGIVIWGGYQQQWDDNAPWWVETKNFLQKIRSNASAKGNRVSR